MDKPVSAPLKRVRLELARDEEYPLGSRNHGYDFIAPIDDDGHISVEDWKRERERCRVKRFWEGEKDEVGHIIRKPGGSWAFHYDIHGSQEADEGGYRFDQHSFKPGEYVSIREHDGELRTFKVMSVIEQD
ncbi:MAG: hypothetical protein KDJ45_07420 [Hyphomicrobiaceae bacterium]|nr:hypothetical protein [Hyphomicrobiaceae bacterium]